MEYETQQHGTQEILTALQRHLPEAKDKDSSSMNIHLKATRNGLILDEKMREEPELKQFAAQMLYQGIVEVNVHASFQLEHAVKAILNDPNARVTLNALGIPYTWAFRPKESSTVYAVNDDVASFILDENIEVHHENHAVMGLKVEYTRIPEASNVENFLEESVFPLLDEGSRKDTFDWRVTSIDAGSVALNSRCKAMDVSGWRLDEDLQITSDACLGDACMKCLKHCPEPAIAVVYRSDGSSYCTIDPRACKGCRICYMACATEANFCISLNKSIYTPKLFNLVTSTLRPVPT